MDTLQHRITGALESDQRKEQVNDAKLRAVAQRVDYDDFCKMVAGAHLKPVKPCSRESAQISKPFEYFVMPKYERPSCAAPVTAVAADPSMDFVAPKDVNDFNKTWRRRCKSTEDKLRFLRTIEPEALPILFRAEMDPAVLDGIAAALRLAVFSSSLDEHRCTGDPAGRATQEHAWVGKVVLYASRVNRFSLTLQLAENSTTAALRQVFDCLAAVATVQDGVDGRVPPDCLQSDELRALRLTYEL